MPVSYGNRLTADVASFGSSAHCGNQAQLLIAVGESCDIDLDPLSCPTAVEGNSKSAKIRPCDGSLSDWSPDGLVNVSQSFASQCDWAFVTSS